MSTAAIRTVLVDDEEPARERLRAMLADYDDLEIVGEACDGQEAVETIDALRPDVIFLDIQMPGLSGLEVAASLTPPRPRVVFCTAFDQYAIEAFEHHAADYLLKPVSRKRLVKAIDRLRVAIADLQPVIPQQPHIKFMAIDELLNYGIRGDRSVDELYPLGELFVVLDE